MPRRLRSSSRTPSASSNSTIALETPGWDMPRCFAALPMLLVSITALTDGEGWKVVVENKPGGVQTIAINEVLRQEADGYTLLSVSAPIAAVPALVPNATFNLETDFAPVVHFATGYNVLVVNPKLP